MAAKDYELAQLAARARHSREGSGPLLKETAWVKAAIVSALLFVLGQYMCRTETALSCGGPRPVDGVSQAGVSFEAPWFVTMP